MGPGSPRYPMRSITTGSNHGPALGRAWSSFAVGFAQGRAPLIFAVLLSPGTAEYRGAQKVYEFRRQRIPNQRSEVPQAGRPPVRTKRARRDSNSQPSDVFALSVRVCQRPLLYCGAIGLGYIPSARHCHRPPIFTGVCIRKVESHRPPRDIQDFPKSGVGRPCQTRLGRSYRSERLTDETP